LLSPDKYEALLIAAGLEETRSELFWGETGLKIWPDVFRHDNVSEYRTYFN
jgi:hypothetical protein